MIAKEKILPLATVNDEIVCMGELFSPIMIDIISGNPTTYTLNYDEVANTAGFLDVSLKKPLLEANFSMPPILTEGTYQGIMTYEDTNNCTGTDEFIIKVNTAVVVEAGEKQTLCSTAILNLSSLGATFQAGATDGTWTSSGSGIFDVEGIGNFNTATTYTPSMEDIKNGSIILTLTSTDAASPCTNQSNDVLITIIDVSCTGTFPWDGNRE